MATNCTPFSPFRRPLAISTLLAIPLPAMAQNQPAPAWALLDHRADDLIELSGQWIGEYSSIIDGGLANEDGFRDLLSIDLAVDLDRLFGLENTTAFAQLQSINPSRAGSADAGDLQGYSNIEIDRSLDVIYELWIEHTLDACNLRLKVGKIDANTEFAGIDIAGGFSNSSAGFSPTIFTLPTYPDPATGVVLFWEPSETLSIGYGFFDGSLAADAVLTGGRGPSTFFNDDRSNDWFHIAQVTHRWDSGSLTIGAWHHTGTFSHFDVSTHDQTSGFFSTLTQQVYANDESDQALSLFAQLASAAPSISETHHHFGLGMVLDAPLPSRQDDQAGLYASHAKLSSEPGAGFDSNETAIDAYYALTIHPNLTLRPEIQHIINPSGAQGVDNATIIGLRIECTF